MSYVAEPYSQVTDQILTALTGGIARESHRFFAGANGFSFERDSDTVITGSVQVIGQEGGAFFPFQQGRDFIIDTDGTLSFRQDDTDETQPAVGATWPDEGSEFFVSYYHDDSHKAPLTDRNVGSLVRITAEAFARELTVLRKQLELVYKSGFVDTAEGPALDMVVALLGLTRKGRDFATGTVRFFRDTPAPADIYIPKGTRVSTALNPPFSFTTTVAKTLRRGQLSVEADVRAEVKGAAGVVAEKTITVINQTILGISGVINDAAAVFGGAAETDGELRARARKMMERAGKATPRAMVNTLTEVADLKENDIKIVEELALRPGVVQVFVARDPDPELAKQVHEAILNSRAAGIRVEHNLAVALPTSPKDTLGTGEARDEGVTDEVPEGEGFQLPLTADVIVYPENPRLTGTEKTTIDQAIRKALTAYVDASAIGGALVYNRMVADIMAASGVLDVNLLLLVKGDTTGKGKRNIDVPEGRRAVLDEKDVSVRFAGAPVNFDFHLNVTPKGGATLADIRKELKAKLVDYFSTNPITVSSANLMTKLGASERYTLDAADLTWNVEYDQAGLIIREQGGAGASTTIAAGDRAVLRDVKVEKKVSA